MSLQQGLNQLLGQTAIAARIGPNFERNVELGKLKRKEKDLNKQYESIGEAGLWDYDEAAEDIEQNILSEQAEVAQKQYELKPNTKTLAAYKDRLRESREFVNNQEVMKQLAMDSMRSQGQAQVEQRNKFKELQESLSKDEDFSRLGKYAQDYITKELLKEDK